MFHFPRSDARSRIHYEGLLSSNAASLYPLEVLSYAIKHGYKELANECGVHTIGMEVKDVLRRIPPSAQASWVSSHSSQGHVTQNTKLTS